MNRDCRKLVKAIHNKIKNGSELFTTKDAIELYTKHDIKDNDREKINKSIVYLMDYYNVGHGSGCYKKTKVINFTVNKLSLELINDIERNFIKRIGDFLNNYHIYEIVPIFLLILIFLQGF